MKVTRNIYGTKVVQYLNPPSCCLLFCLQATDGGWGPSWCFIPSLGGWILAHGVTVRHICHVFVTAVTKLSRGVVRPDSSLRSKYASTWSLVPGQCIMCEGQRRNAGRNVMGCYISARQSLCCLDPFMICCVY